jgi:hypothetical protein
MPALRNQPSLSFGWQSEGMAALGSYFFLNLFLLMDYVHSSFVIVEAGCHVPSRAELLARFGATIASFKLFLKNRDYCERSEAIRWKNWCDTRASISPLSSPLSNLFPFLFRTSKN